MKKYVGIIIFFFCLLGIRSKTQQPDPVLNQLLAIDESQFLNKPVDSLIAMLPAGYLQIRVAGWRKTARYVTVSYPGKVWIELHVRTFNYMNPVDPNHVWDLSLMRHENLHNISISKGGTCYAGCPDY